MKIMEHFCFYEKLNFRPDRIFSLTPFQHQFVDCKIDFTRQKIQSTTSDQCKNQESKWLQLTFYLFNLNILYFTHSQTFIQRLDIHREDQMPGCAAVGRARWLARSPLPAVAMQTWNTICPVNLAHPRSKLGFTDCCQHTCTRCLMMLYNSLRRCLQFSTCA